ncbi:MAG: F0F1 ATP synthase subunit B [Opitutales bacterium]|nr:F0F1 ATP synthase subunit B [Opitutales bacterium]
MNGEFLPLLLAQADAAPTIFQEFGIYWNTLIAQILNFGIVAVVIYYLGIRPILRTIDLRQDKIAESLKNAEEIKVRMAETEAQQKEILDNASREAKQTLEEARQAAKAYQEKQTAETNQRITEMMEKAEQAIEQERKKMVAEVREEIARLVVLTSTRVLGSELGEEQKSRFTQKATEELQKN